MNMRLLKCSILAATLFLAQDLHADDQARDTPSTKELLKRIEQLEARLTRLERVTTGGDLTDLRRPITESEKKVVGSWILADENSADKAGLVQFELLADGTCRVGRAMFQKNIVGPFADNVFRAVGRKLQIQSAKSYSGALSWNRTIVSVTGDELVLSWKDTDGTITESKYKRMKQPRAQGRPE